MPVCRVNVLFPAALRWPSICSPSVARHLPRGLVPESVGVVVLIYAAAVSSTARFAAISSSVSRGSSSFIVPVRLGFLTGLTEGWGGSCAPFTALPGDFSLVFPGVVSVAWGGF
uniref:Uncharacterized protein n=1 Tax=Odontella aurita TaxID=265563 RepID=A0A7S4I453_9STRA